MTETACAGRFNNLLCNLTFRQSDTCLQTWCFQVRFNNTTTQRKLAEHDMNRDTKTPNLMETKMQQIKKKNSAF